MVLYYYLGIYLLLRILTSQQQWVDGGDLIVLQAYRTFQEYLILRCFCLAFTLSYEGHHSMTIVLVLI